MAGRKQHHIPRLLQRGFLTEHTGRTEKVWVVRKSGKPYVSAIEDVAAERDFYSKPSSDGTKTLDDRITDYEDRLANLVRNLREIPIGERADPAIASEVISHLAPRTKSLRALMARGLNGIADAVSSHLESEDIVARLLGLDAVEPDARFQGHFRMEIEKLLVGVPNAPPIDFLERLAFVAIQEGFPDFFAQQVPQLQAMTSLFASMSGASVKSGHNEALSRSLLTPELRQDSLRSFDWHVRSGPAEGAFLPDCVAIAAIRDDGYVPYVMSGGLEIDAVILPLTSDRLLVGSRRGGGAFIEPIGYNDAALMCSAEFVVCSKRPGDVARTQELIGARAERFLGAVIAKASEETFGVDARIERDDLNPSLDDGAEPNSASLQYEIRLADFGDEKLLDELKNVVARVVTLYGKVSPLRRLDGFTFASDYKSALQSVDRGYQDANPADTISDEFGVGHAQAVLVVREGRIKARIIVRAEIALAVLGQDTKAAEYSLRILIWELAEVAFIEQLDETLPGFLLRPYEDYYAAIHFGAVYPAIVAYFATRGSAGFGADEYFEALTRESIAEAFDRIRQTIERERKAFGEDRNVDRFYTSALGVVSHLLCSCAAFLGQKAGAAEPLFNENDDLSTKLSELGLLGWFDIFQRDLETLWTERGRWSSFGSFVALGLHAERLLWRMGVFPQRLPGGQTYLNFSHSAPLAP